MADRPAGPVSIAGNRLEGRRILIVDDSEVIRSRLHSLFSGVRGVNIVGMAADARQALDLLEFSNPDTVILDLRLPEGGGLSVLQEIKKRLPATRVAILTNYPYAAYRKRCTELGADYFFDKATEFEKVKTIV